MTTTLSTAQRRKELMLRCYREFFGERRLDTVADLIHEDFVQHSPDAPSGRDAYLAHLREAAFGGSTIEIRRAIADDEYVVVHYRMSLPDGPTMAVVDIWRFAADKIVEHWDVEQILPARSSTPNGML